MGAEKINKFSALPWLKRLRPAGSLWPSRSHSQMGKNSTLTVWQHLTGLQNRMEHFYTDQAPSVLDLTPITFATEDDRSYGPDRWAAFFRAATWETLKLPAKTDPNLQETTDANGCEKPAHSLSSRPDPSKCSTIFSIASSDTLPLAASS